MNITDDDGLFGIGFLDKDHHIDTFTFIVVITLGVIALLELCVGHHVIRKFLQGVGCCGKKISVPTTNQNSKFNSHLRTVLSKRTPKQVAKILAICILLAISRIISAHFQIAVISEVSHVFEHCLLLVIYYLCFRLTISCIEAFEEVFETRADATSSKVDDMIAPLFSESLRLFVCLIWILQTLSMLGVDTIAATASVSLLALSIGNASSMYVQCLVGTLALIFDEPIGVGDRVEVAGQTGKILGFTLRYCKLETNKNEVSWIPNSAFLSAPSRFSKTRRFQKMRR